MHSFYIDFCSFCDLMQQYLGITLVSQILQVGYSGVGWLIWPLVGKVT